MVHPHEASPVSLLLLDASAGNKEALDRLLPLIYGELKSMASAKLRMERVGHTLNPTALVHEAYLKLVDQTRVQWHDRRHFFAVASQAMRRILLDYAEARTAQKRGGGAAHVSLDSVPELFNEAQARDFIALDHSLDRLAEFNARGADVVHYRFFCGFSYDEIAEIMGLSVITVRRAWNVARAWLKRELGDGVTDSATRAITTVSED